MQLRNRGFIIFLCVLIIALFLSICFTWPLVTKLNTYYSDIGDYPLNGWILWYNQESIKTGRIFNQHLYFNAPQFYPFSYTLAYSDNLFLPSLLFSPIYWFTNNLVFSQNLLLFITFILTFSTSYYSLQFFLKNRFASIIGATIYTFNPLTFAHFPDHFQLMNKFLLPVVFLCTYNYFQKTNLKNTVLFWLFFMLNSLTSIYFFIFSLLQTAILFLIFIVVYHKKNIYIFIFNLLKTAIFSLPFLFITLYFSLPYLEFSQKENAIRSISETTLFSAHSLDFFRPLPNNLIYKNLLRLIGNVPLNFNYAEHVLFLNFVPIILAIFGLIFLYKKRFKSIKNSSIFLIITVLLFTFLLFSFGPYLNLYGNIIVSPFYYLRMLITIFSGIRAPSRFMFMFYFPFALIVGYGFLYLKRNAGFKKTIIIFLILFLLIIVENINLNQFNEKSEIVSLMTEYKQKKSQIFKILNNKKTLHLPIGIEQYEQAKYLIWSTYTKENIMNGYSGFITKDWNDMIQNLKGEFNGRNLKILQLLDVDYLVIHKVGGSFYKNDYFLKNSVFEDNHLLIVNLHDKNLNNNRCATKNGLLIYVILGNKVVIKNNNNCYMVNKYDERYLKIFNKSYITLPVIINPQEKLEYNY